MRISTSMIYDLGVSGMQQQMSDLQKIQQQLATHSRMLTPADDPIAAAQALEVSQSQSVNAQFTTNASSATSTLTSQESVLGQANDVLQNVRDLIISAGNGTLTNAQRSSMATTVQGYYNQLLGIANSTDSNGQYLFSGYKGSTTPFTQGATGVTYNGDQGERLVQISASSKVPVSSSGAEVFQQIRNGNGTFVTAANTATPNTGTGVVSAGVVLNPASAANIKNLSLSFDVTAGVTTYDIVDNTTGNSLLTGAAAAASGPYPRTFTSGSAINLQSQGAEPAFNFGAQLTITGQPATGDVFTVKASSTNQDVFSTLQSLITALNTPVVGTARTQLTNDLNTALSNVDLAQSNIMNVRTKVGTTINAVDAQSTTNGALALQYTSTLSALQDLDYNKAISDMNLKQTSLTAAQKSFVNVQGLSLFNYIN